MELISTHPIKKSDLGFHGNLFGGKLLAWMDAAAAAYAMQVADTPRIVTLLIEQCVFKKTCQRRATDQSIRRGSYYRKHFSYFIHGSKIT